MCLSNEEIIDLVSSTSPIVRKLTVSDSEIGDVLFVAPDATDIGERDNHRDEKFMDMLRDGSHLSFVIAC